ncbi:acyl-CoA carboxylase subunit epsilon [Nocardia australiensis]|uniref:acyl-CoA carboxylase subunit epsilon n=1 Tax=Nocardia australiensis TaxID=2887191 RepID=UPI001D1541D5|nr:acyl-CoA carboxylase subunit epsilon [Nocardia australiensis]
MTTVAEEDVLTAAELDLTVDPIAKVDVEVEITVGMIAPAADTGEAPFIQVIKGAPSDEDVAALVCVLTAAANSGGQTGPAGPADGWGRPTLMHRGTSPFSPYAFPQLSHLRD